jgi:hypothetical protein
LIKPAKNTVADVKTRAASIRPADPNDPNKPYDPNQPPATDSHTVIPP